MINFTAKHVLDWITTIQIRAHKKDDNLPISGKLLTKANDFLLLLDAFNITTISY